MTSIDRPFGPLHASQDSTAPALDGAMAFVNTTGLSKGKPFEDLSSPAAAIDWLAGNGLLTAEVADAEQRRFSATPDAADAALRRVHALRAGLRELIDALDEGRAPRGFALDVVNAALKDRESAELVPDGTRVRMLYRRRGTPLDQALASIAQAVAGELSDGRPERVRICGNDRCRWVFYDRSRPGTRRWCEMASCGNRMKAARHRAKHGKATGADLA